MARRIIKRRTTRWKGLLFTGDTNCGINYQSDFDIANCPGDPNTLLTEADIQKAREDGELNASGLWGALGGPIVGGIALLSSKDQASKEYQNALSEVRKIFPGPSVCVTGTESLPVYQGAGKWGSNVCGDTCTYITNSIHYMQAAITDWHAPRGEQNYVAAYNQVISEYSDYYNAHCIAPAPTTTTPAAGSTGSGSTSGTPAGTTGGTSGSSSSTAQSAAAGSNTPVTQPNINGKPLIDTVKKVPLWAWLVGGGLLATIIVVAIVKK